MPNVEFRRDSAGLARILMASDFGVGAAAERVAANARASTGADVVVVHGVADRPGRGGFGWSPRRAARVVIRDRRGRTMQARDGALTRAAAAAGLEIGGRP